MIGAVYGPWIGEFGWEIPYQGVVRKDAAKYDKVCVISRAGHQPLYQDFADLYIEHDFSAELADGIRAPIDKNQQYVWMEKARQQLLTEYPELTDVKSVLPGHLFPGFNYKYDCHCGNAEYVKPTSTKEVKSYDIIIHARNRVHGDGRNWGIDNWEHLVQLLKLSSMSIACIGSEQSLHVKGTDDYRNLSLDYTIALMNNARLVIGESSGPMHLAMLCDKPVVVWWTGKTNNINKDRYLTRWNFHNSPVTLLGEMGVLTSPADVCKAVFEAWVCTHT